ncbi:tetratricopeptide repeat protein [Aphanothece sacrum]|uniref:Tetratricopeptide repeat domain protein n=1 Tax=Aphanothece sacrum FPU1 TaxID=1920663 RepID=A0A401IKS5_APHSA|nr:tetratricopeptide repeat protein [Aphanothece sacrum]GBF81853.1 tetratricopeptide repeat domain protein [Aphanothece sacrum FPU1]GBF85672.1 tetratricopeptide repeat protein [Aphanothece sacrum FPU3]
MRDLSKNYPDDLDAATLFAESLMDLIPWSYWTPEGQPKPETVEVIAALEEDGLPYMEPPYWYQPVRELLGTSFLKLNQPGEAEAVYKEDLQKYPGNGWSLYGLAESLRMQGKTEAAQKVQQQFDQAWSKADISMTPFKS